MVGSVKSMVTEARGFWGDWLVWGLMLDAILGSAPGRVGGTVEKLHCRGWRVSEGEPGEE